jgi:DNA repair protein RadC
LQAALEIGRRHLNEKLVRGAALNSSLDTKHYLQAQLRDRQSEVFCCLFLDNRHRVLAFDELFRGTIDNTTVYPREVVKQALHRNAAAVILAHNHPSGVADPSDADRLITRRIRDALELVDVRLLDHFIIGDGNCTSLASRGLI